MADPTSKVTLATILAATAVGQYAPWVAEVSTLLTFSVAGAFVSLSYGRTAEDTASGLRHFFASLAWALAGTGLLSVVASKMLGVDASDVLPLAAIGIAVYWRRAAAEGWAWLGRITGTGGKP